MWTDFFIAKRRFPWYTKKKYKGDLSMEKNIKETKLCKYCQSEIPKKAKICPVCKRKQNRGGCLISIIVVIVLFLIIAIVSGGEKESQVNLVGSEEIKESVNETAQSETQPENRFVVGDIVETEDLRITFVSANPYTSDNQFIQPKEGYEYWKFEFAFENISDEDQSVSSMLNWECYADDTMTDQTWIGDENGLDGTLSPGRKTQGSVYFEIPVDSQSIEIEYDINFWLEDKIVFVAK